MKQGILRVVALAALPMMFAGCDALDIFKADSLPAPDIQLTGHVTFNGQPLPVRAPNATQLRLWQTSWEAGDSLRQPVSMGVHLNMDGSYSAMIYPGTYDIQLIDNQGPWVNDTTRIPFTASGDMSIDVPVRPYYTIAGDPTYVFTPPAAGDTTGGKITATFSVGQQVTTPVLELVGLYINKTTFVDRTKRETTLRLQTSPAPPAGQVAANPHERSRAQMLPQLTANQPMSIALILPSNIRLTSSPVPRNVLYARVGVKATGITELAYSKVVAVNIVP